MKNFKSTRLIALLACLCLATSCFVGGTLAKYTSTATATSTATVAKWSIQLDGAELAADPAPTVTFNLFDAAYDLDATGNVDTTPDTDIVEEGFLIAPGCGGSYALDIQNLSEVNAQYSIDFSIENTNSIPLEFSINNSDWNTSIDTVDITDATLAMDASAADTVTIYWRWPFGDPANNATDTALGIAAQTAAPTATVTAAITVDQVD